MINFFFANFLIDFFFSSIFIYNLSLSLDLNKIKTKKETTKRRKSLFFVILCILKMRICFPSFSINYCKFI